MKKDQGKAIKHSFIITLALLATHINHAMDDLELLANTAWPYAVTPKSLMTSPNICSSSDLTDKNDDMPIEEPLSSGDSSYALSKKASDQIYIVKKYFCTIPECNNIFYTRVNFYTHLREVHNITRPFVCEECGLRFKTNANLTSHASTHSAERKHVCIPCGKTYRRKSDLTYHNKSKHNEQVPHKCLQYPMTFLRQDKFDNHLLTHTSDKRFACDYCDQGFTHAQSRDLHKNTACPEAKRLIAAALVAAITYNEGN